MSARRMAVASAVVIIVSSILGVAGGAWSVSRVASSVPDCTWETGEGQTVCIWHADRQGDGRGDSLLMVAGHVAARW